MPTNRLHVPAKTPILAVHPSGVEVLCRYCGATIRTQDTRHVDAKGDPYCAGCVNDPRRITK